MHQQTLELRTKVLGLEHCLKIIKFGGGVTGEEYLETRYRRRGAKNLRTSVLAGWRKGRIKELKDQLDFACTRARNIKPAPMEFHRKVRWTKSGRSESKAHMITDSTVIGVFVIDPTAVRIRHFQKSWQERGNISDCHCVDVPRGDFPAIRCDPLRESKIESTRLDLCTASGEVFLEVDVQELRAMEGGRRAAR
jgi:hypothetical protein